MAMPEPDNNGEKAVVRSFVPMENQANGGARYDLVELIDGKPSCVYHGAMNMVSPFDRGGLWRCLHLSGCRAGAQERRASIQPSNASEET